MPDDEAPPLAHRDQPPPAAVVTTAEQPCQQPPMVSAPPLHYQFYPPMMFPNQTPPPMWGGPPPPYPMPLSPRNSPPNHLYPEHERDWSTGLFQCTADFKNCLNTMFCPCITFGEVAEILTEGHTPWYEPGALCACLGAASFLFAFVLWLTFPYTCLYRVKMRKKYKLKGSLLQDCVINAFCGWCALCQQYRELDHQGFNVSIGWHENKRRERQAVAIFRLIPPEEQDMTR